MPRAFLRFPMWPMFALLAFVLATPAAHSQIRDGGIDPWNLGKGDWIYFMSAATNKLGRNISSVTNENSLMLWYKSQGIRYIIIKAGTGTTLFKGSYSFPQFTSNLVNIAHANGILIMGYNYTIGQDIPGEIGMSDYVFNQGADGFVWDGEGEWQSGTIGPNGPALAWQLCSNVRSNWPNKFLAHAPFPIISFHNTFPYKEFGYWSDAVMPQIYPQDWSNVNSRPSGGVNWTDVNWYNWQHKLVGSNSLVNGVMIYWTNSIKPIAPVNHVYGPNPPNSGVTHVPDEYVMELIDYLNADPNPQTVGGYKGANFWRTDLHGAAQWANIRASTIGNFPGIVNNVVIDDPTATKSGSWTSTRTFYDGTFYGNGSGTDTNSFGTNYLTKSQGIGAAYVQFRPKVVTPGDYNVFQWHPFRPDASTNVPFIITYSGGSTTVYANQRTNSGKWSLLGRFNFAAGTNGTIQVMDNVAEPTAVAIADGLKLVYVSGPAPVTGLTASTVSTSRIDLAWTDNSTNEEDFVVSQGTNSGGPYSDIAILPPNTTHYTNSGLPQDTTYFYVIRAENFQGATNSNEATATTLPIISQAPVIVTQPQSLALLAGQSNSLSVTVNGSNPLRYQWRFNGGNISGATASALAIPFMDATNVGSYSVYVTNGYGTALSVIARVGMTTVIALGNNDFNQIDLPANATNTIAIAAGAWHNLALRTDGGVAAWGDNFDQQCVVPETLTDAVAVAAGGYHSLAIKANGMVAAWGANDYGQASVPSSLAKVIAIAAGTWHSLALKSDGTLVAWGDNSFGQSSIPPGLANVAAIAASGNHSLALKADGTVVAWGENTDAEGTFVGQSVPPSGLSNVAVVAAGEYHSLIGRNNGTAVAWGANSQGQCDLPPQLTSVAAMAGGGAHSLALKADGSAAAWGANWDGQCNLPPTTTNVVGIAAGEAHTLLLVEGSQPVLRLLNPARNNSVFKVVLQTLNRKNYSLEFKSSLTATSWTTLSTATGNGALIQLSDFPASGPQRFYRVRQW